MESFERLKNTVLNFGVRDAADIILIAVLCYYSLVLLKKNNMLRLAKYFIAVALVSVVLSSDLLGLKLTRPWLAAVPVIIAFLIPALFFSELKRTMWIVSSAKEDKARYEHKSGATDEELKKAVSDIVRAVLNMAKRDCGALIVMVHDTIQRHIIESGTTLNSELSGLLLESLFNTHGPLHDGAVLIKGNKIMAAGCFLSLTQDLTIDKELGTRHRAGIGVTETNNVTAIIVSEETGVISVAKAGELKRYYDSAMLTETLEEFYGLKALPAGVRKKKKWKN